MNSYAELLQPISAESPSGPDISFEATFLELDRLILGKEETQFAEAIKPEWPRAHARCVELLKVSHHLYPATCLCLAALQMRGIPGLEDAIQLLTKMVKTFWSSLYPPLDEEEGGDPLERMNILGALAMPVGSYGDGFKFLQTLAEAPLTDSPVLGAFSLADWNRLQTAPEQSAASGLGQLEAAFRDTPVEKRHETLRALAEVKKSVRELHSFLLGVPGGDHSAPDFSPVVAVLEEQERLVQKFAPVADRQASREEIEAQDSTGAEALPRPFGIHSREDVLRALEEICTYYRQKEPSSPIPLLLGRVSALVPMDFLGIMENLSPEALPQIRKLGGFSENKG